MLPTCLCPVTLAILSASIPAWDRTVVHVARMQWIVYTFDKWARVLIVFIILPRILWPTGTLQYHISLFGRALPLGFWNNASHTGCNSHIFLMWNDLFFKSFRPSLTRLPKCRRSSINTLCSRLVVLSLLRVLESYSLRISSSGMASLCFVVSSPSLRIYFITLAMTWLAAWKNLSFIKFICLVLRWACQIPIQAGPGIDQGWLGIWLSIALTHFTIETTQQLSQVICRDILKIHTLFPFGQPFCERTKIFTMTIMLITIKIQSSSQ